MTASTRRRIRVAAAILALASGGVWFGDRPAKAQQVQGIPTVHPLDPIVDNGVVQLGIQPEGHLNVPGKPSTLPSLQSNTTFVGLRYVPNNSEATAPGCLCEGWGVANADAATTIFSGDANENFGGIHGLALVSATPTGSGSLPDSDGNAFKSIVTAGGGRVRVTHDFHASATPNLYQVDVTVDNIGTTAIGDLRYRRVMDWDIAPSTFSEFVEIHVGNAANVIRATTDGFRSADPLSDPGPFVGAPPTTLVPGPVSPDYFSGATDQGALFDFGFGMLGVGASKTFKIFYGAATTRADALTAIGAVGAEVYSLGMPRTPPPPSSPPFTADTDGPNVFIFAFGGVGGSQTKDAPDPDSPDPSFTAGGINQTLKFTFDQIGNSELKVQEAQSNTDHNLTATATSISQAVWDQMTFNPNEFPTPPKCAMINGSCVVFSVLDAATGLPPDNGVHTGNIVWFLDYDFGTLKNPPSGPQNAFVMPYWPGTTNTFPLNIIKEFDGGRGTSDGYSTVGLGYFPSDTQPILDPHADVTVEATSPFTPVSYTNMTGKGVVNPNILGSELLYTTLRPDQVNCSPASGSLFPLGTTQVTCMALGDAPALPTEGSFDVHVVDTTAPNLGPRPDITVPATGANGALVSFPPAQDAVNGPVALNCTPLPSGALFPMGTTTETCTATDASSNTSAPKIFKVTVGCCDVKLTVNPTTAKRLQTVRARLSLSNFSNRIRTGTIRLHLQTSCSRDLVGTVPALLLPNRSAAVEFPFKVPARACFGVSTLTATETWSDGSSFQHVTTLTIVP